MRAAGPQRPAGTVADAERHQRRAVVEVDAGPVPAGCLRRQDLARPLVIEPGAAGDVEASAADLDRTRDRELRLAVVVARVDGIAGLAREARLALEQNRLRLRETQVEPE